MKKALTVLVFTLALFLFSSWNVWAGDYFFKSGEITVTSGTLTGNTIIDVVGMPLNLYWVVDGRTGRNNQTIALTDVYTGYAIGSDSETSATVGTAKVLRLAQSGRYADWVVAKAYTEVWDSGTSTTTGAATFTPATTPISFLGGPTRITFTFATTQGANRTIKFNLIGEK